ncbi:hypothetical protein [Clostridium sp.]|uniref:hypothetical protein n=1 Tax=Clostridium sp. TaxID=1506 RepID=UPI002630E7CF|nr:hypothetical protein [uncultured Clostridium sp.]
MKILMKSGLSKENFIVRKKLNENNIEIQLLKEFYSNEISLMQYFNMIVNSELDVSIIHTPLVDGEDVEIDDFYDKIKKDVFFKTCELANMVGIKFNKNIMVIVHSSMNFNQDITNLNKIALIDNVLFDVFNKYPNILIAIENIIPLANNYKGYYGRNGFLNDNCMYVDYFIDKYGFKDKIGTVLDTCHALVTIKLLEYCKISITLDKFFEWNKKNVMLIHLANLGDNGYGKNNHGIGFIEGKDLELLSDIMYLYHKYEYDCPITIEVREKDYLNPVNYLKTKENLLSINSF